MNSKKLVGLAILVAAVGVGYMYYKKNKQQDQVEEIKQVAQTQTKPSVATPGILPTQLVKPIKEVLQSGVAEDVFKDTKAAGVVGKMDDYLIM